MLAVLGHAPLHLWPFAVISFAWLFLRLCYVSEVRPTFKAGFSTAFWQGLGYFGAGIFWVGSAFIARGPAFIPIMPFMVLGLAALLALFWGLAGSLFVRAHRPRSKTTGPVAVIGFAAIFILAELARGHIFGGFPWNLPGYIFEAGSRPSQIASVVNIYGLSWAVLLLSGFAALILRAKTRLIGGVVSFALLAGLFGYGHLRLSQAEVKMVEDVKLRLVSVPFHQSDQFDPETSVAIVNDFITASMAPGIEDVTHLIWPEGAVSGLAMDDAGLLGVMGQSLISADNTPPVWIMNSLRLESRPNPRGGDVISDYYNSAVAVTFDARGIPAIAGINDKHRLVPFGEFFPGGKWLEQFNVPIVSTALASITPAPTKTLTDFPGLPRLASLICYEADFPGLMPIDNSNPAGLILNLTNDAWYGRTWGPAQHANIARYRTIEEGVPMVRVAANGLSGVIDPYGRIVHKDISLGEVYVDVDLPRAIYKLRYTSKIIFFVGLINLVFFCLFLFLRLGSKQ